MPSGIIVKGIGGFYYVHTDQGIIECKARGKFRKQDIIPLVGDKVEVALSSHDTSKGSIESIHPRTVEMIRPPVANVDQLVIVCAITSPEPNLMLLDKFLLAAENKGLEAVLCINKIDLDPDKSYESLYNIYQSAGYKVICTSKRTKQGIEELKEILHNRITAFAGSSGVGKSSLLNAVDPRFTLQTGEVSKKIERGKHTTRHVELLELENGGYVVDTPGFSTFELAVIKADELGQYYREFQEYTGQCRFRGCSHTAEPGCAITEAVGEGSISPTRHENYVQFYQELKKIKEWEK